MAAKNGKKVDKKGSEAAASSSFQLSQTKEFAGEVKAEFKKIAWPDKKHTLASTGVVVVFVIIISFYLGAVDLVLGKLIALLIG